MTRLECETVLENWVKQAIETPGQLADGIEPAAWAARQFLDWWIPQVAESLADAEAGVSGARSALRGLGGWNDAQCAEALHELAHIDEALNELRSTFGIQADL
jgi:hypothetical protein